MIIDYDHNPKASYEQKLQSLKESVQLALNEISSGYYTKAEVDRMISEIKAVLEDCILKGKSS